MKHRRLQTAMFIIATAVFLTSCSDGENIESVSTGRIYLESIGQDLLDDFIEAHNSADSKMMSETACSGTWREKSVDLALLNDRKEKKTMKLSEVHPPDDVVIGESIEHISFDIGFSFDNKENYIPDYLFANGGFKIRKNTNGDWCIDSAHYREVGTEVGQQ